MKKFYLLSALLLTMMSSMHLAHAEQNDPNDPPMVDYVHHVIVNNCFVDNSSWSKIRYELTEPTGVIHKGYIYPGTDTIHLDKTTSKVLSGVYVLHYSFCGGSIVYPYCRSYSASINIQHNANIVWELNLGGMTFNQTDL